MSQEILLLTHLAFRKYVFGMFTSEHSEKGHGFIMFPTIPVFLCELRNGLRNRPPVHTMRR